MSNQATVLTAISRSEAVDTCILDSLSFILVKILFFNLNSVQHLVFILNKGYLEFISYTLNVYYDFLKFQENINF